MAIAFLFKVNNTDMTGHVVQNTYKINNLPVYKEYTDANGMTHKRYIRNRFKGSMQMVFSDIDDYLDFRTLLDESRSPTNFSVPVTLYDNLTGDTESVDVFIDYEPTVMQTEDARKEYMKVIDVSIEER